MMAVSDDSKDEKNDNAPEEANSSNIENPEEIKRVKRKSSIPSPTKSDQGGVNKNQKQVAVITGDKDIFCWQCHKQGSVTIQCQICPRIYHRRCSKLENVPLTPWTCIECTSKMMAESLHTRSEAMKSLSQDELNKLLKFVMERIQTHDGSKHFINPVDVEEYPNYKDFIINPMDLTKIEKNISAGKYQSTETFLADLKWLVHNSYIFNSVYSHLTSFARGILKIAKQETDEIENCPNCYYHAHTMDDETWFIEPCKKPHLLIWAKLRGFPHWPGKIMKVVDDLVDVRFFGDHNRAWIPSECCYLYSKSTPGGSRQRNQDGFDECLKEVTQHIQKLIKKFGHFQYAIPRTKYTPALHNELLAEMLPSLKKNPDDNKTESRLNGCLKRRPDEDPEVIAQKKKKVEDCLEKLHLSKVDEEVVTAAASVTKAPGGASATTAAAAPATVQDGSRAEGKVKQEENGGNGLSTEWQVFDHQVAKVEQTDPPEKSGKQEIEVIYVPDHPSPRPAQGGGGGLRLKLKPTEELLSSAALQLHKSNTSSSEGERRQVDHVDEIIEKVCNGDITVDIPVRESVDRRPVPTAHEEGMAESTDKSNPSFKKNSKAFPSNVRTYLPSKAVNKKMVSKTNKIFDLGKDIDVDNINDISTWSLEPYEHTWSTNEALDNIFRYSDNVQNLEDAKSVFQKLKKLVTKQKQEMKEFYCKMRQEAQEVCDVFLIEQEKLNEIKQDMSKTLKKVKRTQWCSTCLKQAKFYCCWGTSYCSYSCQNKDWASHYENCSQSDHKSPQTGPSQATPQVEVYSSPKIKPMIGSQQQPALRIRSNLVSICEPSSVVNTICMSTPGSNPPLTVTTTSETTPQNPIVTSPLSCPTTSTSSSSSSPNNSKSIVKAPFILPLPKIITPGSLQQRQRPLIKIFSEQKAIGKDSCGKIVITKTVTPPTIDKLGSPPQGSQSTATIWSQNEHNIIGQLAGGGPQKIGNKFYLVRQNTPVQLNGIAKPLKVLPMK